MLSMEKKLNKADGKKRSYKRRPHWLKIQLPGGASFYHVNKLVRDKDLHTVCQSAHCPNIGECWNRKTATFMIMGEVCSRNCSFCAVNPGKPAPLNADEPRLVAEAIRELGLRYAVVTSVTRDDLADGGAEHFARTIEAVRRAQPGCKIEVLIPDLKGDKEALYTVLAAKPDVLNHNLETVERLYHLARPQARYARSLELLERASENGALTKSGIMVGLGETLDEVRRTMRDLLDVHCQMLTIGQYLQPSANHLPVERFVTPEEFEHLKTQGLAMGFDNVQAGPLVRSSYLADEQFTSESKS